MPQLDIFFFLPTVIYLFLLFFLILFYLHFKLLPKMAMMIKIRRWPARHWPFPLYLQVECVTIGEPSDFLDDDDDFVDFAEDLAILEQESIFQMMEDGFQDLGERPSKEEEETDLDWDYYWRMWAARPGYEISSEEWDHLSALLVSGKKKNRPVT